MLLQKNDKTVKSLIDLIHLAALLLFALLNIALTVQVSEITGNATKHECPAHNYMSAKTTTTLPVPRCSVPIFYCRFL
jgi:hypothetical protein